MKNGIKICFVLVGILALASAQLAPAQITRFIILDGLGETLVGITHDLKTSPGEYDAEDGDSVVMRLLAPFYYLESKVSGTGSLSFDYDTDNKVVYFGCSWQWTIYRINTDGSNLEPIFASEYIFIKHLNVDFDSNTAYFTAYAIPYVNRTVIITADVFFSTSYLNVSKLAFVVVKANLITGETEEVFNSIDMRAVVFNNNYDLLFVVGTGDIKVMTLDKTVVDVITLPTTTSALTSTVLYDRLEDVIYVAGYASIFYLRYATQESGQISVSGTLSPSVYTWHDAENKAFYFIPSGSGAAVYHLGYESFETLISNSAYAATLMFQITQATYGLFALACDGTTVADCGWNSPGLPTYMVVAIVLLVILPCLGCIGFIVAAFNRKEMNFPVDQWANVPLNGAPDSNAPEH